MELKAYEKIVSEESKARNYVSGYCRKNCHRICPRCSCRKLYKLGEGRRRCSKCKYTFSEFAGRWLNHSNISCTDWLRVVKLFELELSTRKIAKQAGLTYKRAYLAVTILRLAIMSQAEDGEVLLGREVEMDESYFGGRRKGKRGRGAAGKVPVFGILEREGRAFVQVVPNVTAKTLLDLAVKKVRRGSIVYTDKYGAYDSLMFCGYRHLSVDHARRFSRGKVSINGMEGFWSWAKERIIKHHGVSPERFPLYLKELEFRYNNREEDIFPLLVSYITNLVPNVG